MAQPTYADKPQYHKERAQALAKAKGSAHSENALRGITKWQGGKPTLVYARVGYQWVEGKYVKTEPKASGVVMRFGPNRKERRAEAGWNRRVARKHARAAIQERRQLWLERG